MLRLSSSDENSQVLTLNTSTTSLLDAQPTTGICVLWQVAHDARTRVPSFNGRFVEWEELVSFFSPQPIPPL